MSQKQVENEQIEKGDENTAPADAKPQHGGLDSIVDEMAGSIPEVQEHAVEAYRKKNEGVEVSESGEKFNPEIHAVKDGKPILTAKGKFRKKYKKRDVKDPRKEKAQKQEEAKVSEDSAIKIESESRATAELIETTFEKLYDNILGYKTGQSEKLALIEADTAFLISKGGVNLSPAMYLVVMQGQRLVHAMTSTKEGKNKLTGLKAWAAGKWVKFKGRKKNGAQSDIRTNNVGKNDTGNKDASTKEGQNRPPVVGA